jgi:hypothetical protein
MGVDVVVVVVVVVDVVVTLVVVFVVGGVVCVVEPSSIKLKKHINVVMCGRIFTCTVE